MKGGAWSLDEVDYTYEVRKDKVESDDGRIDGVKFNAPQEGAYIHGLYMEGAAWDRAEQKLKDSVPKELFISFPVIHVSAISTVVDTRPGQGGAGKKTYDPVALAKTNYFCPVYKYPVRNDKYLITRCWLPAESKNAPNTNKLIPSVAKWKLCGVALLCQKD